jgi:peroxin-16
MNSNSHYDDLQPELQQVPSVTITLKRSGKVLRKIENSPPLHSRTFQPPELRTSDRFGVYNHKDIKTAELVYIFKPMLHLGSCAIFGYKSWKSYALSMFLDLYSIRQYYNNRQYLTSDQKKEMSRRCVSMLLYILRSPFYDQFSNDKIDSFMRAISRTIPFAKLIVEPYRELIPHYQQSYFYMFSN